MTLQKIRKVLIANRGEISCRVQDACTKLGVACVVIASEADKDALFVRCAKESVVIGAAHVSQSYLAMDKIIAAAKAHGADSIHPGYGFLSENAQFAKKVSEAGLIFIGPDAEAIETLGNKTKARQRAKQFGVPITAGSVSSNNDELIIQEAKKVGFPLIIKAASGGGGRGMRVVRKPEDLASNAALAKAEALKFFSDDAIYVERFIEAPRHVEVQVLGDAYGNVVHIGTRDCSTQRRNQKLVEEAPAPSLSDALREKIHNAAVRVAQSVNYKNAGTAEFLVKDDEFYFLEMNTRIQVEHPVSEIISGLDLVELQLRIADGQALPFTQKDVKFSGHAIEYRIYAEDPARNFAPATGKIKRMQRPVFGFVREDKGFEVGDQITPYYDAMLSKLIVKGQDRAQAIARSREVLASYEIEGFATNLNFHRWLLLLSPFRNAPLDIAFIEKHFSAKSLDELEAAQIKDPLFRAPIAGAEQKDLLNYRSNKFSLTYTIEVLHRNDHLFLAAPILNGGKRAAAKFCRLSNGLNAAVKSLVDEVLETVSPEEIY